MKTGLLSRWMWLCVALFATTALAAPTSLSETRINGTTYYSLRAWADAKNLGAAWIKRNDTLQVTNSTTRVRLNVSSREADAGNVSVWLLFPIVNRKGGLYISKLDAETTLQPLFYPPRNPSGKKVKTICIDPGHGGKDPGYQVGSQQEKIFTLLLAFELREQLRAAGFNVILTRSTDTFLKLPERPDAGERAKADLLVSLHFNATAVGRGVVKGIETYALTPAGARSTSAAGQGDTGGWTTGNRNDDDNMLLAWNLQKTLTQRLRAEDRGVRRARFWVLRDAKMPAVLIEGGFMSHPVEGRKIADAAYRHQMARAFTQGILAYKQTVERKP